MSTGKRHAKCRSAVSAELVQAGGLATRDKWSPTSAWPCGAASDQNRSRTRRLVPFSHLGALLAVRADAQHQPDRLLQLPACRCEVPAGTFHPDRGVVLVEQAKTSWRSAPARGRSGRAGRVPGVCPARPAQPSVIMPVSRPPAYPGERGRARRGPTRRAGQAGPRTVSTQTECQNSATALPRVDPGRPIDWQAPSRPQAAWNDRAVCSLPWSVWKMTPGAWPPRTATAVVSAP